MMDGERAADFPMEAIVLAGGFGTRLRHIVSDVPKPMAPMDDAGTPFLHYVLEDLARQGAERVILSTGYKSGVIEDYFGGGFQGMELVYSREDEPLGTGGAVKLALESCRSPEVFVLNGDTFFAVDLAALRAFHRGQGADFTLAMKEMFHFDRYGALEVSEGRIRAFHEKRPLERGWINGGVYCLRRDLLTGAGKQRFSLETDFLEKQTKQLKICGFPSEGYFIDIGIPEDYYRAQREMK